MSRIDDALDRILVRSKGELFSRIEQVSHEISIENTQAMAYCYVN